MVKKTAASLFYDDYAHHTTEIRATLAGARSWYPNARVVAIFQPHTYSRTKALEDDFCRAFAQADVVLLTDIYPSAREKPDATISTQKLVRKMVQYQHNVRYTSTKDRAIKFLRNILKPGDIIITMGAGDIYTWQKDIIKILP